MRERKPAQHDLDQVEEVRCPTLIDPQPLAVSQRAYGVLTGSRKMLSAIESISKVWISSFRMLRYEITANPEDAPSRRGRRLSLQMVIGASVLLMKHPLSLWVAKVRWKVDLVILPIFLVTQALQFMDRTALNYANLFGYKDALGLKGQEFNYLTASMRSLLRP